MNRSNTKSESLSPVIDYILDSLRAADRSIILLYFHEGHSYAMIGKKLDISETTTRLRIRRALDKLAQALKRKEITTSAIAIVTTL